MDKPSEIGSNIINQEQPRILTSRDLANAQTMAPQTPVELWYWVRNILGVEIPYTRVCADHCSPFEAFAGAYFAKDSMCVWKASRGFGGKTHMLALLALTEAITLGASVNLLGGSGEQSKRVHGYINGTDSSAIGKFWGATHAPRWLLKSDPTLAEMTLINGGRLKALMASQASVRGPHPNRLRLDECLAGWSKVPTGRGLIDIVNVRRGDSVVSWDEGKASFARGTVSRVAFMGVRPTLRIRLASGRELVCTYNHEILTQRGWQRADTLRETDFVFGLRDPNGGAQQKSNWSLPKLLGSQKKCRKAQESSVRGLRLRSGNAVQDLSRMLFKTTRHEAKMRRLWEEIAGAGDNKMPQVLASNAVRYRQDPAYDDGARNSVAIQRYDLKGRGSDDGASSALQAEVQAFGSDGQMGCGLHDPASEGRDRSARGILARQAGRSRARHSKAHGIGAPGMEGAVHAHRSDAFMVRVIAITEGPVTPVYDITVPTFHNFVAEGVVVHNCDEIDLNIFDAAMGQTMESRGILPQTVMSSTHQYADGTMTEILRRAKQVGFPCFTWCYKESLEPFGWLPQREVDRKRREVPKVMWDNEYEMQEPSPEGRAIDQDAVRDLFDTRLGNFEGHPNKEIRLIEPLAGHKFYHGTDWAKTNDWTVVHSMWTNPKCRDNKQGDPDNPDVMAAWLRTQRMPWPVMIGFHNKRVQAYGGSSQHDITGIGNVCDDYLEVPSEGFNFSNAKERADMLATYIAAIENRVIRYPFIKWIFDEHKFATWQDVFGSGRQGHLPDTISAGALARRAKEVGRRGSLFGRLG